MIENKYYNIGDKNISIALITDLHFDDNYDLELLNKIEENIKINKPNYICLSGDIIDTPNMIKSENIKFLKEFIKNLSSLAPLIVTLGNHDIAVNNSLVNFEEINEWFKKLNTIENVFYLNNKSIIRDNICFTSYNPDYEYYKIRNKKEALTYFIKDIDSKIKITKKYYNVLLCHSPIDVLKKDTLNKSIQIKKVDLILSGHMHNGLVFSNLDKIGNRGFVGPYYTLFPKTSRGKIEQFIDDKKITLIINGGIVKISKCNSKYLYKINKLYPSNITYITI